MSDRAADAARDDLAGRAGVDRGLIDELVNGGVIAPGPDGVFGEGDVRRVRVLEGLARGGLPRDVLTTAVTRGMLPLDFVDQPSYSRFSAYAPETFAQVAERTGIPLDLLLVVREAMGSPTPEPGDRVRQPDLAVVPFLEVTLRAGVRPALLERTLRVAGDGLRRLAETEADWWRTEIIGGMLRAGVTPAELGSRTAAFASELEGVTDDLLLGIYHGQQAHAWMRNIFEGFEEVLAQAGLHTRSDRQPAIAFVDITGYSRFTEERGDVSAAELAGRVARLVQREAADHGGRAIKWLGDGVMLFFADPGQAVAGCLDMMDGLTASGLPTAHAGIHTGPVLFQEGDYFGRTVNTASRIGDEARAGQVLVSQAVVDVVAGVSVAFESVGTVALRNLNEPVVLWLARRAPG